MTYYDDKTPTMANDTNGTTNGHSGHNGHTTRPKVLQLGLIEQ